MSRLPVNVPLSLTVILIRRLFHTPTLIHTLLLPIHIVWLRLLMFLPSPLSVGLVRVYLQLRRHPHHPEEVRSLFHPLQLAAVPLALSIGTEKESA